MWMWITIIAIIYAVIGIGFLIKGSRKHGPIADATTLLLVILLWPIYWKACG